MTPDPAPPTADDSQGEGTEEADALERELAADRSRAPWTR